MIKLYSKFICTSDWHVRSSTPKYRVDDFPETIFNKIGWLVRLSNRLNYPIIVSGDIFHNVKVPIRTVNRLIRILRKCRNKIYCIAGQHDLEFHSDDLTPTPYQTLIEAGVIVNLGQEPIDNIYGLSWNQEPRQCIEADKNSILVMHYCVTPENPAFFLEDDALSAEEIMNIFSEFRFVITGDYHKPHVYQNKGKVLINSGSLCRSNRDQIEFEPRVYILDTDNSSVEEIKVPIKPGDVVFKVPDNDTKLDIEFSKHIETILQSTKNGDDKPDFNTSVRRIMKDLQSTDRQREIAEKFLKDALEI